MDRKVGVKFVGKEDLPSEGVVIGTEKLVNPEITRGKRQCSRNMMMVCSLAT